MTIAVRITVPELDEQARDAFRQSVDKRRHMTSRFVRKGASYGEAIRAAHTLFPLAKWPAEDPKMGAVWNLLAREGRNQLEER